MEYEKAEQELENQIRMVDPNSIESRDLKRSYGTVSAPELPPDFFSSAAPSKLVADMNREKVADAVLWAVGEKAVEQSLKSAAAMWARKQAASLALGMALKYGPMTERALPLVSAGARQALVRGGARLTTEAIIEGGEVALRKAATEATVGAAERGVLRASAAEAERLAAARIALKAHTEAATDAAGNYLRNNELEGILYTTRRVEGQGYQLAGSVKFSGNQGIDLTFKGIGQNQGRFALTEAKASWGLNALKTDTQGFRQGSRDWFLDRLQKGSRFDLIREFRAGNVDTYVGLAKSDRLFRLDPNIFTRNQNFRHTPGAAVLVP